MNQNRFREQEINLKDFFFRLLEQWKLILIVAIIFAIVLPSAMSVISANNPPADELAKEEERLQAEEEARAKAEEEAAKKAEEEAAIEAAKPKPMSEGMYLALGSALSKYAEYVAQKAIYDRGALMNVNEDDNYVVCSYAFSGENLDMGLLKSVYSDMRYNDGFNNLLIKNLSPLNISDSYGLYDVMTLSTDTGYIVISTYLPKKIEPRDWRRTLTGAINAYKGTVKGTVGEHEVTPFSIDVRPIDKVALEQAKNGRQSNMIGVRSSYEDAYNGLDDISKAAIDEIIGEVGDTYSLSDYMPALDKKREAMAAEAEAAEAATPAPSEETEEAAEDVSETEEAAEEVAVAEEEPQKGGFSLAYVILGFIIGVILYAAVYLVIFIFRRLVRSENDLYVAANVRNFGGLYEYPYSGTFAKFLHDKKVFARRVRAKRTIEQLDNDIASKLEHLSLSSFTLIPIGKLSANAEKLAKEQIKDLSKRKIDASMYKVEGPAVNVSDHDLSGMQNVILVMLGDVTGWKDLGDLYGRLTEYDVNIIGSEFIQA